MRPLLVLPFILLAGATSAATRHDVSKTRYDVSTMSCAQIDAILSAEGSAILAYRSKRDPSLTLYDRFVVDARFCRMGDYTRRARVRAAEGAVCPVRVCREYSSGFRP